jgi:hypothetical protein
MKLAYVSDDGVYYQTELEARRRDRQLEMTKQMARRVWFKNMTQEDLAHGLLSYFANEEIRIEDMEEAIQQQESKHG